MKTKTSKTPWRKEIEPPGHKRNVLKRIIKAGEEPQFLYGQFGLSEFSTALGWTVTHWMDIPEIPKDL